MTKKELDIKKELEGTELQDNELENVTGGVEVYYNQKDTEKFYKRTPCTSKEDVAKYRLVSAEIKKD